MANKKKLLTSVAAFGTAAALLLSGTFAWQSINQTALNEASDVINPGGRLHDDFNGENKDIYVENFADEPIYARIRLEEYFEIIANYGAGEGIETSTQLLGAKETDDAGNKTYTYTLFNNYASLEDGTLKAGVNGTYDAAAEEGNDGYAYWTWKTGGSTIYMPTFNLNKDSLKADINGIYEKGNVGTISDRILDLTAEDAQYSNYKAYTNGETLTGNEIYDADANNIEEEDGGGTTTISNVEHTAKPTGTATLISMSDWDGEAGPYWVYDTDGWVYWAQAIEPDTATGLLLDSIELNQVMDDTWYYAINVVAQFVTADDVGKIDDTGFYADGQDPTAEAEALLKAIGVTSVDDEVTEEGSNTDTTYFELKLPASEQDPVPTIPLNTPVKLVREGVETIDVLGINYYSDYTLDEDNVITYVNTENMDTAGVMGSSSYTYVNNTLTITDSDMIGNLLMIMDSEQNPGFMIVGKAADDEGGAEEEGDTANGFRIYSRSDDEGTNYADSKTVSLGEGTYDLYVSNDQGGHYIGENPNDFVWSVEPTLDYSTNVTEYDTNDYYVSITFTLDSTVPAGTYTVTATNEKDSITRTAYIVWAGTESTGMTDEELQEALNAGGNIDLGENEITAEEAESQGLNVTFDYLMSEGGTLTGGTINSTTGSYATLFINNELGWPNGDTVANNATIEGTTINTQSTFGVYAQAINADVALNNVTVNGSIGGVYAEYGTGTVTLTDMYVTAEGGNTSQPWFNSAVAAGMGANVVVESGYYQGDYAAYVFSSGATLTIKGGTFYGKLQEDKAELIIQGGTFDNDPTAYVADGYEVVENGDGTWTVQEKSAQSAGLTYTVINGDTTLARNESVTIKVDGDYTADDLVWGWTYPDLRGAICVDDDGLVENDDGSVTITHKNSNMCGGSGEIVRVSLVSDPTLYLDIVINCGN